MTVISQGRTYTINVGEHGEFSILCHQCERRSYNWNDVMNQYCGYCQRFHAFMQAQVWMEEMDAKSRQLKRRSLLMNTFCLAVTLACLVSDFVHILGRDHSPTLLFWWGVVVLQLAILWLNLRLRARITTGK